MADSIRSSKEKLKKTKTEIKLIIKNKALKELLTKLFCQILLLLLEA